jgi:hypothetical protein
MCSLKEEPWREYFTGPVCRCGVPTPGNEEERLIDLEHKIDERAKRMYLHKLQLNEYTQRRLTEILRKHGAIDGY